MTEVDLYNRCNDLFEIKGDVLVRKVSLSSNARIGDVAGYLDGDYYRVCIDNKRYLLHRILYLMQHKNLPKYVDHIDGDTKNNVIGNLREVTKAQNRWNCNKNSDTQSGYKGVYKDGRKWKAMITRNGVRHYLGLHETPELAAKVVEGKSKELSGEYHRQIIGENN